MLVTLTSNMNIGKRQTHCQKGFVILRGQFYNFLENVDKHVFHLNSKEAFRICPTLTLIFAQDRLIIMGAKFNMMIFILTSSSNISLRQTHSKRVLLFEEILLLFQESDKHAFSLENQMKF